MHSFTCTQMLSMKRMNPPDHGSGADHRISIESLNLQVIQMNGIVRAEIKPGTHVKVVQKQDQRSGNLTEGIVKDVLTKSSTHPHGIKVRLESGIVGRVKKIIP